MEENPRDFWREFLSWPKREKFQFTVRSPLWLMVGVAICGSCLYWESMPELPVAAAFVWAIAGLLMGLTNRM